MIALCRFPGGVFPVLPTKTRLTNADIWPKVSTALF